MKSYFSWSIIFVLLLGGIFAGLSINSKFLAAEKSQEENSAVTAVTPHEAQHLMLTREDLIVADVRTLRERKRAAIAGSVHISMGEVFKNEFSWSQDQPLLLYCAVGGRSSAAADWLQQQGFSEIYNLVGGIVEWQKQGLPIVSGATGK
jgi:rhodanese-related sulfurtransferase